MIAKVMFLSIGDKPVKPFVVADDGKIMGQVPDAMDVKDGEEVDVRWYCRLEEKCWYPFCNGACPGSNSDFRLMGKEPILIKSAIFDKNLSAWDVTRGSTKKSTGLLKRLKNWLLKRKRSGTRR